MNLPHNELAVGKAESRLVLLKELSQRSDVHLMGRGHLRIGRLVGRRAGRQLERLAEHNVDGHAPRQEATRAHVKRHRDAEPLAEPLAWPLQEARVDTIQVDRAKGVARQPRRNAAEGEGRRWLGGDTVACPVPVVCYVVVPVCDTECYVRSWRAAGSERRQILSAGYQGRQILTKFLRAARAGKSRIKF